MTQLGAQAAYSQRLIPQPWHRERERWDDKKLDFDFHGTQHDLQIYVPREYVSSPCRNLAVPRSGPLDRPARCYWGGMGVERQPLGHYLLMITRFHSGSRDAKAHVDLGLSSVAF